MSIFFTADTHFGHTNIIKYCNRPYSSTEENDNQLIKNYNEVVGPKDIVYFLGDFCFKKSHDFDYYFNQLNGQIHFIEGNHDRDAQKNRNRFASYSKYREIKVDGITIVLCHYAFRVWNKSHHGSWHLYGHSHGSLPDDPHARSIDVGVDCHNYRPIEFNEIKKIMDRKLWQPIDHHGTHHEAGGVDLSKSEYARADRKRQYEQLKKEFEYIVPREITYP